MEQTIDLNPIPYLTWSWLKINKDSVTYDFSLTENNGTEQQIPDGVSVSSGKKVQTQLQEPENSIGKEADEIITSATTGKIYTFQKGEAGDNTKPLIIRINVDSNCATHNIIHAKAGSVCKVILVYEGSTSKFTGVPEVLEGPQKVATFSGVITKIYAEEDSCVNISKVQLCDKTVNQIDDTQIVCGERAKVSLVQIELGGSHIDAGFHATLAGYESKFVSNTAYICKGTQYLDMNQVVVHKGRKTVCNMQTHGTVKDETTKTYRGTIDMRKGCAGSTGNEMETTLLLSSAAVVKAAPIILCGEEDIAAEHGSTVGKLSNDMLFYMNTRGIDKETAEALLTKAKISATAAGIEDEDIRQEIENYMNR